MAYSFLDLAHDVLNQSDAPLTYQEIWDAASASGVTVKLKSRGKTPWATLGALLYVDVRDNPASRFVKVGKRPARFFLAEKEAALPSDAAESLDTGVAKKGKKTASYLEKDLHPLLAYHAYANPSFNRGRSIHTKTIVHQRSSKPGYSEWLYPDMVGFYLPVEDWSTEVIELNRLSDNNSLRLFSFELKRELTRANYREAYFQAVSNSSWAHEGYLVAADIVQEDELLSELERLASSFGIGILHLDLTDFGASSTVYPARVRTQLDWETINRLCDQNQGFKRFLEDVRIDFEGKRVHSTEYDAILEDPEKYIEVKLKT